MFSERLSVSLCRCVERIHISFSDSTALTKSECELWGYAKKVCNFRHSF